MEFLHFWSMFICLNIFFASNHGLPGQITSLQLEERRLGGGFNFKPATAMKKLVKSEEFKSGIPDFVGNLGVVGALVTMDYTKPATEIFKNVVDAALPLISAGLSLIPGGSFIAGIVTGLWGLISPLFGGEKQKSPIEILAENIKEELDAIKKDIAMLAKEIPKQNRKDLNDKFKDVLYRAVHGEMSRNQYVCSKYSLVSNDFIEDLTLNRPINESLRIEMIGLIHSCDNFLKDTAESFVYPEFADVLWVPSVITAFIRLGFLAEIASYGIPLQIDESILRLFWAEIKQDINRTLLFSSQSVRPRIETIYGQQKIKGNANFTEAEYQGCKLQRQLLFFDRQIYPYGIPKFVRIFNDDAELNLADFNVTNSNETRHIQVYYNELRRRETGSTELFGNCFMGQDTISRVSKEGIIFRVKYIPLKSYQLRVLYFTQDMIHYWVETHEGGEIKSGKSGKARNRRLSVDTTSTNIIKITVSEGSPNEHSSQRFMVNTGYTQFRCSDVCKPYHEGHTGTYVIETVAAFDIPADAELNGKIVIENPTVFLNNKKSTGKDSQFDYANRLMNTLTGKGDSSVLILGAELIVLNSDGSH